MKFNTPSMIKNLLMLYTCITVPGVVARSSNLRRTAELNKPIIVDNSSGGECPNLAQTYTEEAPKGSPEGCHCNKGKEYKQKSPHKEIYWCALEDGEACEFRTDCKTTSFCPESGTKVCTDLCSLVLCVVPVCESGESIVTPEDECCPVCMEPQQDDPDHQPAISDRCATVSESDPHFGRFEGTSYNNECHSDTDCSKRGCMSEVCSAEENAGTTCELLPNLPSGTCGCVENQCIWYGECDSGGKL